MDADDTRKLDRLIEEIERLVKMVEGHDLLLHGTAEKFGLIHQVRIMWRIHMWILCSLSALCGSVLTILVNKWL